MNSCSPKYLMIQSSCWKKLDRKPYIQDVNFVKYHTHDLEKYQTRQHHITSDYLGGGGLKGHLLHVGTVHTSWKALSRGLGNTPRDGEPGGAVGTTSIELFSQYLPLPPQPPKRMILRWTWPQAGQVRWFLNTTFSFCFLPKRLRNTILAPAL